MTRNLEKVLIQDPDFFTCARLRNVTEADLRKYVFTTAFEFCLVDERARILNEMAQVIENEYTSSFYNFVCASGGDVPKFVDMVTRSFSGFRDEAIY